MPYIEWGDLGRLIDYSPPSNGQAMAVTLSPEEQKTAILRGTIPDLKREGDCWEVHFFDGFGASLTGYRDVRTGKLVFLWLIPEG